MEIKILGPLEATECGASIVPTAGKPRQVLALLALWSGRIVPASVLMDELWGAEPPRSAPTTLQTYILQLRRRLDIALSDDPTRCAKDILRTQYNGYVLDIRPEELDVQAYERLATAGQQALDARDDEAASRLLGNALAHWRGPVLVDVQPGARLAIEVMRLEESRLGVLERRIDADLRLGRHHKLLSELAVLTVQHPWHENLHAQHMVALYRSGRQWHALDVFKRLRGTLVNEFGLEPSPRLQQLQRAILSSDPALETPVRQDRGRPGRMVV
ncbi:AfsR/SARP family transcriptional regulator [Kitasatospora sp. NBC_01287]|uniref:AfsR/SARP family transcriptional regulator n=1 Tax=Kitasatospora sp. NBC_01287 TaxID=2903573 RepID=UPI00225210A9|nr:AfsR/SARP family transcriptional regulator [Kitasatospora sp. NBC_01287]MCX4748882.1 AfsR/SARP family transcriptional regulator [Kitasatospora sp. NBC_01287]